MKQPVDKKKESKGSVPTKKQRDLPPLDLGTPVPGEKPTLEIKGDNTTILERTNGHAKMKTKIGTAEAQNLLREWWGGMRLRQRTDWVTHTFREYNKEAMEALITASAGEGGGRHPHGLLGTPRMFLQKVCSCTRE